MRFLIRLIVIAAALWVAVRFVPGIEYAGHWSGLLAVALVFGVVNAVIRPILFYLTCPLVLATLGLFVFVLNGLMLWLTGALSAALGIGFSVNGIVPAILGALVVGVVSTILSVFVGSPGKERGRGRE
jgi:putative membrane protein